MSSDVKTDATTPQLTWKRMSAPARWLLLGGALFSLGRGAYTTASVVFFTHSFGMTIGQVALALSVAGVAAVAVGVPAGWLADRCGARRVAVILVSCLGLVVVALPIAGSFPALLAFVVVLGALDRSISVVRRAMISHVMGSESRVRIQAWMRSVANVGVSIGALAAAPALAVGTRGAFTVLCFGVAGCYAATVLATTRLPKTSILESKPEETGDEAEPASNARQRIGAFVTLGLVNGLLTLHNSVLKIALPLWVVEHTDAPRWTVSALIVVNTVLTVLFQVAASRGSGDVRGAGRSLAMSGVFTAAACLLVGVSGGMDAGWAITLLVCATVVLTAGELFQSAGEWGLSFGLAPAHAQGRYIGAFSFGSALHDGLGPLLVVSIGFLAAGDGPLPIGWMILAVLLLAAGTAVPPLRRAAQGQAMLKGRT